MNITLATLNITLAGGQILKQIEFKLKNSLHLHTEVESFGEPAVVRVEDTARPVLVLERLDLGLQPRVVLGEALQPGLPHRHLGLEDVLGGGHLPGPA